MAQLLILVAIFLASCSAPRHYRLTGELLTPPPPSPPAVRRLRTANGDCNAKVEGINLAWRRDRPQLTVNAEILEQRPGSVVLPANATAIPAQSFPAFTEKLAALEAKGCLAPGQSQTLQEAVIGSVPMSSRSAHYWHFGQYVVSGYAELYPTMRIKVVTPTASGYDTTYQSIPPPGLEAFPYLRMFFLTRLSSADHNAVLLAARTYPDLVKYTRPLSANPEEFCRNAPENVTCRLIPKSIAASLELRVIANGKAVYVPLGAAVSEALRLAGV